MKKSSNRILTTHVGALPEVAALNKGAAGYEEDLREAVAAIVRNQRDIGLDVINEGEYAKGGDWLSYVEERFDGFEAHPPAGGKPLLLQGKDREEFADFYQYATARGTLFYGIAGQISDRRGRIGSARGRSPIAARRHLHARLRCCALASNPGRRRF